MKVLKFGGTSVGSVNSILSVKKIVEAIEEPVIVVVSALGGITDKLLATSSMAAKGDVGYEREFSEIITRHLDVIQGVIPDKMQRIEVQKKVMSLLDELGNIFKGVYLINDLSAKTSDTIVSYGERISSLIVSNVIKDAKLFDSRKFIKTLKQFNKHIVDFEQTNQLIKETFNPLPKVSLVPGFISSSTENGEVTNLGRGGSDYTASILATALDANVLEIWTDVDGFMTADPRVISSAYVIDRLTFTEAMELCNFGGNAKQIGVEDVLQYMDEHIQSGSAGNLYLQGKGKRRRKSHHQRYFLYQRHLPDYRSGTGHGWCDRCKLPYL